MTSIFIAGDNIFAALQGHLWTRARNHRKLLPSLVVLLVTACGDSRPVDESPAQAQEFIGSQACRDCHQSQHDDWQGSHHQLAMQVASGETVLGDFSGATFDYYDTKTEFITRDGAFIVRTENGNGQLQDFNVTHAFGVTPLQQYLVDFPGGRKQVPSFAWDTRPAESGGQRWYHLYPDEYIGPGDPLHWTSRYFNWNYMCAECHSTNVALNYELETDTFDTTYSEVSVGCEACHGPGSLHVDQAQRDAFDESHGLPVNLGDRGNATWVMNPATGIAEINKPDIRQQQPESCGRCHARRSVLTSDYEYGEALTNTHMPSLLEDNLYHADGRILDEVYVYGSFVQSKMYAAGVTCSDCHNPHSGNLVTGPDANAVCSQCHLPTKFATSDHSGSNSMACVDCHMPATTYMGVDDRRDHSFRIPGTDQDKSHYGAAIAAGRAGAANSQLLSALANPAYPAIARATILTQLAPPAGDAEFAAVEAGLEDPDPLVRVAALRALRNFAPEFQMRSGSQLLRDPVRGVRVQAAATYVELRDLLPVEDARAFTSAAEEYRAAQLASANMPESLTVLSGFESQMGNMAAASRYLEVALKLDPRLAITQHAYGLLLVRSGRSSEALDYLHRAAELEPTSSRFVYVLGVALNSLGHKDEALTLLTKARSDFPGDFDIAWGLATMLRDYGNIVAARSLAEEMTAQFPDDDNTKALLQSLPAE